MKNRIEVLARLKKDGLGIVADALQKAKSAEDRARVLQDAGVEITVDGGFETVWHKTVRIIPENGEDVVIEEPAAPEQAMAEGDMEEEGYEKSAPAPRRQPTGAQMMAIYKQASDESRGKGPAIRSARESAVKTYTRGAAAGGVNRRTGKAYVFEDGEQAEYFGAAFRYGMFGDVRSLASAYTQKDSDRAILTKAHGTNNPTLGGAFVPEEFLAQVIELRDEGGAFERAVGTTNMIRDVLMVPRVTGDVTFTSIAENSEISAQNQPTSDLVKLVAEEIKALLRVSNTLLNDSAISIADLAARSIRRGRGIWLDQKGITGVIDGNGWANRVGANSTYDAANGAPGWADYTATKITGWIGKVAGRAWRSGGNGGVGIVCNATFYHSVLRNLAFGAGGATPSDIISGVGPRATGADAAFDGLPVYFSDELPATYSADQLVAYVGNFRDACKLGSVAGGLRVDQSDQRYFEFDQVAFRAIDRVAVNNHDVDNATNPMVVALQD